MFLCLGLNYRLRRDLRRFTRNKRQRWRGFVLYLGSRDRRLGRQSKSGERRGNGWFRALDSHAAKACADDAAAQRVRVAAVFQSSVQGDAGALLGVERHDGGSKVACYVGAPPQNLLPRPPSLTFLLEEAELEQNSVLVRIRSTRSSA